MNNTQRGDRMKKIVENGFLIKNNGMMKELVEYKIMFLNKNYLDDILALQAEVLDSLENPDTFVPDTRDFIRDSLISGKHGKVIGVLSESKLIAYRTINFPRQNKNNLGRDISLSTEALEKVAHLESTVVHPHYRGNKLQSKMLPYSLKSIKELGYETILTTISPYNYPSLKNVMDYGLTIIDLKHREGEYEGKLRYLLTLNLIEENRKRKLTNGIKIKNNEILMQQQLLRKGYRGYKIVKQEESFDVYYRKYM